jgi:gamma-glutamyl-gamma-aminobutyrate hydrolase PuuD
LFGRCRGLAELVAAMQGDKSRDVRELVAGIEVHEPHEEEAKVSGS